MKDNLTYLFFGWLLCSGGLAFLLIHEKAESARLRTMLVECEGR